MARFEEVIQLMFGTDSKTVLKIITGMIVGIILVGFLVLKFDEYSQSKYRIKSQLLFGNHLVELCKNPEFLKAVIPDKKTAIIKDDQIIAIDYYLNDSDLKQTKIIHNNYDDLTFLVTGHEVKVCSLYEVEKSIEKFSEQTRVEQISRYVFDILNLNRNLLLIKGEKNELILEPLDSVTIEENQIEYIAILDKIK